MKLVLEVGADGECVGKGCELVEVVLEVGGGGGSAAGCGELVEVVPVVGVVRFGVVRDVVEAVREDGVVSSGVEFGVVVGCVE